ncbi:MAG: IclR family transcriptional regulator [Chloroflexi bacterium]|nr:IclR family transcriptional regulator [Chloroflexota bacterium]
MERAMRVLKCLSQHTAGLTLSEISREVDLHKATALRLLKTLEQGGFATTGNGKAWRLGSAFLDIRTRAIGQHDIRDVARPLMDEAAQRARVTVHLAILVDGAVVYIEKSEPRDDLPLRINTQVGTRRPMHCTALGKLMAAFQDPRQVEHILEAAGTPRFTPQTITSLSVLRRELARIRRDGYAVDDREMNELVVCAAAPVRDAAGSVVAAVSISTFGTAVQSPRFRALIQDVTALADRISAALGGERSIANAARA